MFPKVKWDEILEILTIQLNFSISLLNKPFNRVRDYWLYPPNNFVDFNTWNMYLIVYQIPKFFKLFVLPIPPPKDTQKNPKPDTTQLLWVSKDTQTYINLFLHSLVCCCCCCYCFLYLCLVSFVCHKAAQRNMSL